MGFLTRFIASGISDGATRDEALRAHLAKTMKRCEELCVSTRAMARENGKDNWDQPTKTDKHWLRDKARMVYVDSQHAVEHPGRRAPW